MRGWLDGDALESWLSEGRPEQGFEGIRLVDTERRDAHLNGRHAHE